MKAKVIEVALHKLPAGKTAAAALEDQLNEFFGQHAGLRLISSNISTLVEPVERNAMPRPAGSSIIVFCTLFYTVGNPMDATPAKP
jgi:hypothetical protein